MPRKTDAYRYALRAYSICNVILTLLRTGQQTRGLSRHLSRGVPSVLHGSWPGPWLCLRLCDRPSFEKALRTPHAAPPCILRLSVAPRAERAIQLGLSAEELGKRLRASHGCIPLIPCCWSASRIHTLQRLIISTAVPQRREGAAHQSLHRVR